MWQKLVEIDRNVPRGSVLRLPASYPHEDILDLMIFEPAEVGYGLGTLVVSGYKSGLILAILPLESYAEGSRALSLHWLKANFSTWIYPDTPVDNVFINIKGPEAPSRFPVSGQDAWI